MIGTRTPDGVLPSRGGQYGRVRARTEGVDHWHWFVIPPGSGFPPSRIDPGRVTEYESGTVTVEGSLVVEYPPWRWQGYLVRGEWSTLADSVLP